MDLVLSDIADGVATLTLHDPDRRNVVSAAMNDALVAAVDRVEADPDVGAIIVTGAPPAFSAAA